MKSKKMPRKRSNVENLRQWQKSRREAESFNGNNISNIEPRKTRLQAKLINPVASTVQEEKPIKTEPEVSKRKRQGPVRKYGRSIVINDENKEEEPSNSKAKTLPAPAKPTELIETLQMLCWNEDLSPVQKKLISKREEEYNELIAKIENMVKQNDGETVYKGDTCAAYQYTQSTPAPPPAVVAPPPEQYQQPSISGLQQNNVMVSQAKGAAPPGTYQLVMDARLGVIVGTMTPAQPTVVTTVATPNIAAAQPVGTVTPQIRPQNQKRTRARTMANNTPPAHIQPTPPPIQPQPFGGHSQPSTSSAGASTTRAAESTAVGGLAAGVGTTSNKAPSAIVDLTSDDGRPPPDSREVVFNKLQGKTFPSLVVVARPHLHNKEAALANDRALLDTKVKAVLVHTPTKFTEWLIQQGLVRSEQHCILHPTNKLNLGMYSDVSKFPYSGGYVWISECCPHRFVSVFSGSLFEGATHPPSVILKLIYHWACHTNIQNVVQWVKVDNLYVKGLYTWLRAVCTYALQQHLRPMGGPGQKIEVGVISLGTTSQDGSQRQVKVEVLGIYDPELRLVRLRAVEPLADGERNYKKRFSKILEPLRQWVHPESVIHTDLTVDKGTLHLMGFGVVLQNSQSGGNQGIMEYLRKIVPRMFQNTLSLLSRQIIQQFLDELVWREWFGQTAAQAFDNMVKHIAEQTRLSYSESLIVRLNKVAWNPFKNYSLMYHSNSGPKIEPPARIKRYYGRKRPASTLMPATSTPEPEQAPKKMYLGPELTSVQTVPSNEANSTNDTNVPLEIYYYGSMAGEDNCPLAQKVALNVRCCVCKVPFTNNIQLLDHLLAHAHNMSTKGSHLQCRYCLASLPNSSELLKHISTLHPIETRSYGNTHPACILCEQRFSSIYMLGKHMSKEHVPMEMPYQCGACQYRCSSHRQAIDHFYKTHEGTATLQCPFCLKCTAVWSSGRTMPTNVTFFLAHLQKHQRKSMAKKCYKCSLWFIQKDTLKEHQQKAHQSFLGKRGVQPWDLPANYVMVPKSKIYHRNIKPFTPPVPVQVVPETPPLHNLQLIIPRSMECKECHSYITHSEHYPQKLSCSSCAYITDCANAMQLHKNKCRKWPVPPMPPFKLPSNLFCVCGYVSDCGNQMAKHLALCERRTAYPTSEMARAAASDTHSMLDVLGLVRRNDDGPCQSNQDDVYGKAEIINLESNSNNPADNVVEILDDTPTEEEEKMTAKSKRDSETTDKLKTTLPSDQIKETEQVDKIDKDEKKIDPDEVITVEEDDDIKEIEKEVKDEDTTVIDVDLKKTDDDDVKEECKKEEPEDTEIKEDSSKIEIPDDDKPKIENPERDQTDDAKKSDVEEIVDEPEVKKPEVTVTDNDKPEIIDLDDDKPEIIEMEREKEEPETSHVVPEVDQTKEQNVSKPEMEAENKELEVNQVDDGQPKINETEVEKQPEVDAPEVDEPGVDEPEADVPEVDEPEVDEPEVNEPEMNQCKVDEQAVVSALDISDSEIEKMEVDKTRVESSEDNSAIINITSMNEENCAPEIYTNATPETEATGTAGISDEDVTGNEVSEMNKNEEITANIPEVSQDAQQTEENICPEVSDPVEPMETSGFDTPIETMETN